MRAGTREGMGRVQDYEGGVCAAARGVRGVRGVPISTIRAGGARATAHRLLAPQLLIEARLPRPGLLLSLSPARAVPVPRLDQLPR